MIRTPRSSAATFLAAGFALVGFTGLLGLTGCTVETTPKPIPPKYTALPPAVIKDDFMRNTVHDRAIVTQTEPHNVSSYGLIGQLRGTGDCTASNIVRQYMIKEMVRRGFGDALVPGYAKINPVDVLRDPNYAIVRVDAYIPPGARKDDWIDAQITCLSGNLTTSLAHGSLFETDLKDRGADVDNPSGAVNTRVVVKGPVVVNPAYALENPLKASPEARNSLRTGSVLYNAKVKQDRPIMLQVRIPQGTLARRIQDLVAYRFQDVAVAQAIDEAIINLYVPRSYRGDWQHFVEVVRHLYMRNDAEFNVNQAKLLATAALQPDAMLEDIAYCWEGIGSSALESIRPLLAHSDPRVAYFAARAAAFIGDPTQAAEARLMQIAQNKGHPYRLAAVRTLGQLPPSSSLNAILGQLLDSDMTLIRIAAYQILCRARDNSGLTDGRIQRTFVAPTNDPRNQKFVLDVVRQLGPTKAPPLIYVSRAGIPRIAIIGYLPSLNTSSPMSLADNRLTFAREQGSRNVVMYYREPQKEAAIRVLSQPDVDLLVARLGGMGAEGAETFNFTYGEVVAILQKLAETNRLTARDYQGHEWPASFVMQDPGRLQDDLANAPLIDVAVNGTPQFGPGVSPQPRRPVVDQPGVAPPNPTDTSNAPRFGPAMPPSSPPPAVPPGGSGSNAPKF
jgi:flagellar basal body P-ring protein FlgI